jgi:hypothetical protein
MFPLPPAITLGCCSAYSALKMEAISSARHRLTFNWLQDVISQKIGTPLWEPQILQTPIMYVGKLKWFNKSDNRWHNVYNFQCDDFKIICLLLPSASTYEHNFCTIPTASKQSHGFMCPHGSDGLSSYTIQAVCILEIVEEINKSDNPCNLP